MSTEIRQSSFFPKLSYDNPRNLIYTNNKKILLCKFMNYDSFMEEDTWDELRSFNNYT